jgi:hypothetical protein
VNMDSRPQRRWLQFSLRTFLVLLTVFGVWLGLHVRSARKQKESVEAIRRFGGWYYYDFQKYDLKTGKVDLQARPWAPAWLLAYLGEDFFHDVVMVNMVYNDDTGKRLDNNRVTDEVLPYLEGVPDLTGLFLHEGQASDAGMKYVGGLKDLQVLMMWDAAKLTDAGVSHLGGLSSLRSLHISESPIGDESLRVMAGLPRIERLSLQGNRFTDVGLAHLKDKTELTSLWIGWGREITDAGLAHLSGLTQLEELDLQNSQVTRKGLEHLKALTSLKCLCLNSSKVDDSGPLEAALPNCKIDR